MGLYVENNQVKKDWLKTGWLELKSKGGKKTFIFATQEYESTKADLFSTAEENGKLTVFFVPDTAFVLCDADDNYVLNAKEVADDYKGRGGIGVFPHSLDEYCALIETGEEFCLQDTLERFGLEEHKEDIEARLKDVAGYGEEFDVELS